MGCDIHVFVEVKFRNGWHPIKAGRDYYWPKDVNKMSDTYNYYSLDGLGRDYTFFGVLAGVRDEQVTPMKEPEGLPNDIYPGLASILDTDELHTPTWYGVKELLTLWKQVGKAQYKQTYTPNLIKLAQELYAIWPKEDMRFIICFDN